MYDSEYFRKVIGSNYNPNELYDTTYDNSEGANIRTVDMQMAQNNNTHTVDMPITQDNTIRTVDTPITQDINLVNNIPVQTISNNVLEPAYDVNNIRTNSALEYLHNMNKANTEEVSANLYSNTYTEPLQQETYNVNNKITYPDIYNVINPMLDTVLKNRQNIEYNEATINAMSTEVYNALEVDVNPQKTTESFNNTIQVNAKPKNYLLHDLIKIMLIGKIEKGQ